MSISKSNALYMRIVVLIFSVVLLVAVLTNVIYTFITPGLFADMKAQELIPRAENLANTYAYYQYYHQYSQQPELMLGLLGLDYESMRERVARESNSMQAYIALVNSSGQIDFWSYDENGDNPIFNSSEDIRNNLNVQIDQLLAGETVVFQGSLRNNMISTLVVGVPVMENDQFMGAAIIIKPLREIIASLGGLNRALLISLSLGFILISIPILLAIKTLLKPLGKIRIVAMSMAQGDFTTLVNEVGDDEIGQLGMTLNYLSRRLSGTISELVVERNRLEQILDGLTEGIIACDEEGNITHLNPAISKMFKTSSTAEEKLKLVPYQSVWDGFDKAIKERVVVTENINVDDMIIFVKITPLEDKESEVAGAVGLFSDITEAERLEQTRRDYVANVSHELRTPLTALRGLVEPLKDGMVKDENKKQKYYEIMLRETLRLSRLIDDLLQLSRLQSGTLAFEKGIFSIEKVVLDVKEKYSKVIEDKGIQFGVNVAERCPLVQGNADRVEQILTILVDNACKFTKESGRIDINVDTNGDKVLVGVKDTGCGIPKNSIDHVFERFYKVDKARTGGGTGLGLSIASEILEQMGESITVSSVENEGSEFVFTLPVASVIKS